MVWTQNIENMSLDKLITLAIERGLDPEEFQY